MRDIILTGKLVFALLLTSLLPSASAEVVSETIEYRDGNTLLTGHLYFDDSIQGRRPGVLVIHEWWGLNDYAKKRAEMLADMGYVAFAADMYGDNRVTTHARDAKGWMTQITSNVDAWQQRARLGLEVLKKHRLTRADDTAAIGYCFGGATVMQLAYSGSDVDGVVSFHGSLPVASEAQAKAVKTRVMVAHGYADSFIPKERVADFKSALDAAGVDWQFNTYSGARHGFTNPDAGTYGNDGLAYDANADRRSWQQMSSFLAEVFAD